MCRPAHLFEGALEQQGLKSGVQLLAHPLQQHRVAKLDGVFQAAHVVRLGQLEHLQLAAPLHVPDPLVGLPLHSTHTTLLKDSSLFDNSTGPCYAHVREQCESGTVPDPLVGLPLHSTHNTLLKHNFEGVNWPAPALKPYHSAQGQL